jgi:hypothetical protein
MKFPRVVLPKPEKLVEIEMAEAKKLEEKQN